VTAQVPATNTNAESMRLEFTPETWTAAETTIRLRNRGEQTLGWDHTHPQRYWCRDCPEERRSACPLQTRGVFFSAADVAVHRAVFSPAYSLGLLAHHTERGVEFALFGWRLGMIENLGFYVLSASGSLVASPAGVEEESHDCSRTH
jgi:hypothetical protein